MSKKMHDILPPKAVAKIESTLKELAKSNKKRPARGLHASKSTKHPKETPKHQEPGRVKKERKFPLIELLVGAGVIVFLLCAWGFVKLPKADIQIWPKTETLTLNELIVADKSANVIDLISKKIPARYVEVTESAEQEFPATSSASSDGKATGTIKIYNKISPSSPFTLKVGTHFLSNSGKYFVTTQKVTIPGSKNGVPGFVNASVQAEGAGADYNIGASKFSVPKLNGTEYYYSIYGESNTAMSGGYTGRVKKVSDDDLQSAKEVVIKQLTTQTQTALKNKLSADEVLLDGAMASSIISSSASVKAGTIADTFTQKASVKVSALVFNKQDLNDFIKSNIDSQTSDAKNYLENSLTLSYAPKSIDISGGKVTINVSATAKTYYTIDTQGLVDLFSTKSVAEVKQVMDQMYSGKISELKINLWPFWVTTVPKDKTRIKVNLNF